MEYEGKTSGGFCQHVGQMSDMMMCTFFIIILKNFVEAAKINFRFSLLLEIINSLKKIGFFRACTHESLINTWIVSKF